MKNPFAKQDNNGVIVTVLLGGLALGAVAYLYLTESGGKTRKGLKKKLKQKGKDLAANAISKKTGLSKKLVKKVANHVA